MTRPINYTRLVSAVFLLLGAITLFTVVSPYVLPFLQSRNLWAAGSLIAILLFTSGHMFNHIRKVPYVAGDGRGGMTYFAGGFSNQLGMETQIIAAICKYILFWANTAGNPVPRPTLLTATVKLINSMNCRWNFIIRYHFVGRKGSSYGRP